MQDPNLTTSEIDRVNFPKISKVETIEAALASKFSEIGQSPELIKFDLSESKFIDVASLLYIMTITYSRKIGNEKELKTKYILPKDINVCNVLWAWHFHKAIEEITRDSFEDFLISEDDKNFYNNNKDSKSNKYTKWVVRDDGIIEQLLSVNFFAFSTFHSYEFKGLAEREKNEWKKSNIYNVLTKNLDDSPDYVNSRIIYEVISNATRHPKANIIQTASMLQRPYQRTKTTKPKNNEKKFFTIVAWDDGESMIDTLYKAIKEGKEIRSVDFKELHKKYQLILKDSDSKQISIKIIKSTFDPNIDTPSEEILLSTLFPGVTRDVKGEDHEVAPELAKEDERLAYPGMGLYALINAAVDIFKGEVSFRTKDLFMNIKKAKTNKADYRVKVQMKSNDLPEFLGNMITVRIPLKTG